MAARKGTDSDIWRPRSKLTSELQLHLCGSLFTVDKELLAIKSAKIARLMHRNPNGDLSALLRDIPADQESMEIVGRFCHGFPMNLSTENIVRVCCVAKYLEMFDAHSPENLLTKSLSFFERHVIASWNDSVKALKTAENILDQAAELGLVEYCVDSIISKATENPHLLGEPIFQSILISDSDENADEIAYRPNARRKLFDVDWKSEDLTSLSLRLYAPIIHTMIQRKIPQEYIAANICQYAKTWLFSDEKIGEDTSIYKRNSQREIVEALVQLLPQERDMVTCTFLFHMLRFAIALDASLDCRNGLELRIGKQLDQATVKDMLIPSQGYAKDEQYDTECVRRILKNFYLQYTGPDPSVLTLVAELIDEFLIEISSDIDLKPATFIAFADMSVAASEGLTGRTSDDVYRAIDIYLDKHRHLTESEREEICKVLKCNRLSSGACEHAAQNERLPVRFVVQALFVAQLKLREAIPKMVVGSDNNNSNRFVKMEEEQEEEEEEGGTRMEIEKMGSKVKELERECSVMRREIERGGCSGGLSNNMDNGVMKMKKKKEKMSMWKEMKRKFGCGTTSMNDDCHCHVKKKKVHPR